MKSINAIVFILIIGIFGSFFIIYKQQEEIKAFSVIKLIPANQSNTLKPKLDFFSYNIVLSSGGVLTANSIQLSGDHIILDGNTNLMVRVLSSDVSQLFKISKTTQVKKLISLSEI